MVLYFSNQNKKIFINNRMDEFLNLKKKPHIKNNTYLLHWCRYFQEDIMMKILDNFDTRENNTKVNINSKEFKFVY